MSSIVVLSTDTAHHRYFLNRIADAGISVSGCVFETTSVQPPFETGPVFDDEEAAYEAAHFFENTRQDLERFDIRSVPNFNEAEAHAEFAAFRPTLGVVFGARRLTPQTISMFPGGLINVHRGIAQAYRGLDSDLWAIYHRDYENLGTTIHLIDDRLDTGEIIAQERLDLTPDMRCHQIRFHTSVMATSMVITALQDYLAGHLITREQQTEGRYYSFMPKVLKKIVAQRFDRHCAGLGA